MLQLGKPVAQRGAGQVVNLLAAAAGANKPAGTGANSKEAVAAPQAVVAGAGASNKERHEFVGVMEQMLKAAHGAEVAQQFKDKVCGSCVWGRAGQFCVGAGRGAACILSIK